MASLIFLTTKTISIVEAKFAARLLLHLLLSIVKAKFVVSLFFYLLKLCSGKHKMYCIFFIDFLLKNKLGSLVRVGWQKQLKIAPPSKFEIRYDIGNFFQNSNFDNGAKYKVFSNINIISLESIATYTTQNWSFLLITFLVKVNKSAVSYGFVHIWLRNPKWQPSIFVRFDVKLIKHADYVHHDVRNNREAVRISIKCVFNYDKINY